MGKGLSCTWTDPTDGRTRTITRSGTTVKYPEGNTVTYSFSGTRYGDLASISDSASGLSVSYTYDSWHNLETVRTNLDGAQSLLTLHYTLGTDGRSIRAVTSTNALGGQTETQFGVFNQPTQVTEFGRYGHPNRLTTINLDPRNGNPRYITRN